MAESIISMQMCISFECTFKQGCKAVCLFGARHWDMYRFNLETDVPDQHVCSPLV